MKSMDLLETIGSIRDKYILEAHSQTAAPKKRIPTKRLVLIAAIIALMLLLVGCVAYILERVFAVGYGTCPYIVVVCLVYGGVHL